MTLVPWLVLGALILANALYVAAEFSAVAVQRSQIAPLAKEGNRRASRLLALLEDGLQLDRYIAACQIGITLTSLIAGAYAQATLTLDLAPWLETRFALGSATALSSAALIVLLALTVAQVVFGELVPKSVALQFPIRTAFLTHPPTQFSASLFRPFIWLLNGSAFLLLRLFGVKPGAQQHVHSPEEIQILLAESRKGGALSPEAYLRLERGLRLSKRTVRQMMTPRSEVYAIDVATPPEEALKRLIESPFTSVPIYRDTLDDVLGIVNAKDVAAWFATHDEVPPLSEVLRPVLFVPETLRAHRLVRTLKQHRTSKAIVVDEFGGVEGIVSIEDVLRQLFGEIGDELKQPEPGAEILSDGTIRLPGSMSLDQAEPYLGTRWTGSATTVGGHVVTRLGKLPQGGEELEIEGVWVKVAEMGPTAIRWLLVKPRERSEANEGEGEEARDR